MNTHIALFRGINVGGHHLLPMNELVSILEYLGYESVQTYIQSGNAVFRSRQDVEENGAAEISREILARKGFEPQILLLSPKQLMDAIENNPFPTGNGKSLHFSFLRSLPHEPDEERLRALKSASEEFRLKGRVFYLYAPDGIGSSKLAVAVEKALGVPLTGRNWNTVNKLAAMVEQG